MKALRRIASLIAIATLATTAAVAARPSERAKVAFTWNALDHNFGAFNEDMGPVTCRFKGVNTGTDTTAVIILSASCGCTQPVADKRVIPPGDSLAISVTYDPAGRPGVFDKRVKLVARGGYTQTFHIRGSVIGSLKHMKRQYPYEVGDAYRVSSDAVLFGNTREDRTVSTMIRGINNTESILVPVVKSAPEFVTAIVEPDTVQPGDRFVVSLTADGPKVGQLGVTMDKLTLTAAGKPEAELTLPVSILLFREFPPLTAAQIDSAACLTIPNDKIDLGTDIDPKSKKTIKRKVKIANAGHEPLEILRAYSITPGFTVKAPKKSIPAQKDAEIEIIFTPAEYTGEPDIKAYISLISNSPLNTDMSVTVTGAMKK